MSATAVAAAVVERFDAETLKNISNDKGSASTSVSTARIVAAATDAIGDFERIVGVPHDSDNASHMALLVKGTVYYLETYKSRDSSFAEKRGKDFYGALIGWRKTAAMAATSNSNLSVSRERRGTRADMDTRRGPFKTGGYLPGIGIVGAEDVDVP